MSFMRVSSKVRLGIVLTILWVGYLWPKTQWKIPLKDRIFWVIVPPAVIWVVLWLINDFGNNKNKDEGESDV